MQTNNVSDTDLRHFVAAAKQKTNLELGYEIGQRYARVFISNYPNGPSSRCVFCFIDLTNGNVLRAEGWKRPNLKVKNSVQGNVFDDQKGSGAIRGSRL
jgi:hypothetical protein